LHDCPPERLGWALSTRVLFYAKRAMEEPCPLKSWPSVPASYIVCAEDRTVTPAWQRRAARELLGVEPLELPGGHCPNVSRPEALADVLEQIGQIGDQRAPKSKRRSQAVLTFAFRPGPNVRFSDDTSTWAQRLDPAPPLYSIDR
jgi:Alpha/beta hydrolase family